MSVVFQQMWNQGKFTLLLLLSLGTLLCCQANDKGEVEREDPHRNPSLCEVCKFLTTEVQGRLDETGKIREVLETGYGLDQKKKRKQYKTSELRLIEVINDPHVCEKILEYNVHAERQGSRRFAKGRSETMETLHGLVHKGVKVELGIPYEMWDTPSASVTEMQRQCYMIVENYEEQIEDWYWNHQDEDFTRFLCKDRLLRHDDQECLSEVWTGKEKVYKDEKSEEKKENDDEKKKKKKDKKKKGKEEVDEEDNDNKEKKKDKSKLKGDAGTKDPDVEEDTVAVEEKDEL